MKQENIWKKSVMTGFMLLCLLPAGGCFGLAFAEEAEQAQEYIFPESDGEYLTEEELAGLPLQVIAYGKYEIFARRGMLFQSEELQNYFSGQNWYFGFIEEEEFPDSLLNEIETANLQLLGEQEEALSEGGYQTDQEGFAYDLIEAYLAGEEISEAGPAENTGEVPEGREAGEEETDQTEPESEAVAETESETVTGAETEAESET
ncbi:MAG: YARHG domain-containing protein, partial [Lachnospiraceae bacterium]|nr:YARHG domain-containing protein [Lachnospiraceae bacterium]